MTLQRIAALGSLLAFAAAVWVAFDEGTAPRELPRVPDLPREVSRMELKLREGRLFQGDETLAFTGIAWERYPNGSLKSRTSLVEGLLEGPSEGWATNGVLVIRETFRAGTSHGTRTKWYPSGALRSEAPIESGAIHGVFKRWHEDGSMAEEVAMENNVPHGWSRSFHPGGALKAEVRLDHGRVVEQRFGPDLTGTTALETARAH